MKNDWGWDGKSKSWDTWIILSASYNSVGYADTKGTHNEIKINLMYCTSKKTWEELKELFKSDLNTELNMNPGLTGLGETLADTNENAEDLKEFLKEIVSKLSENPIGTALSYFFGLLRDAIGDTLQSFANNITFYDGEIVYSYDELESSSFSKYNEYTNVSKKMEKTDDKQEEMDIKAIESDEDEDRRFSKDTKIPVIMMDLYNVAANNIPMFDINFLTINNTQHPDKWITLRNFFTIIVRIIIFVVAAVLIVMLIYNGIQLVVHSSDNPKEQKKYKDAIKRFAISIFMLVGSIVIVALSIYGANALFETLQMPTSNDGPIRVFSREGEYSFSTTITGYYRYMAEIEGVNRCLEKGANTLAYILLALTNVLLATFMIVRLLAAMVLAAVGPIIAGCDALDIKLSIKYSTWARTYVCLAIVPVIFALFYKIILIVTF